MSDPNTPAPEAPSTPAATRNDPVLNQAQVLALTKAEQIVAAARKPAHLAALDAREIPVAVLDQLDVDIEAARKASARAIHSSTDKEGATLDQAAAKRALLAAIQEVQSAAKQKYARRDPVRLQDYFVGKRLDQSRADLLQYSSGILLRLQGDAAATPAVAPDPLPGISAAKIAALAAARKAYSDAKKPQSDSVSDASDERDERDDLIASITDRRIEIQFAADAEWPYSDEGNAGVRREFYLPLTQPYNG